MKRIAAVLIALLLSLSFAQAQSGSAKSKGTLTNEINANFPDQNVGAITPQSLRQVTLDMLMSYQQYATVNAQTGTTYSTQIGDYGKLVTINNASSVVVTLPQATGSFSVFNVFYSTIGVGAAVITPTTSTINGAASLTLTSGQAAWVVSDGTNYQVVFLPNPSAGITIPPRIVTVSGNVTVSNTDVFIALHKSVSGDTNFLLPSYTTKIGPVTIWDADGIFFSHVQNIVPNGAETIYGLPDYPMTEAYQNLTLYPTPLGWMIGHP